MLIVRKVWWVHSKSIIYTCEKGICSEENKHIFTCYDRTMDIIPVIFLYVEEITERNWIILLQKKKQQSTNYNNTHIAY